jgi:hypothetical protein
VNLAVRASHQIHILVPNILLSFSVQSRNSQSYEPLLLENEREAVADLLQYLESVCFLPPGRLITCLIHSKRPDDNQLFRRLSALRADHTLVF